MNVKLFTTKDYENEPLSGPKKTNPIKPCPERSRMGQFPSRKISAIKSVRVWPDFLASDFKFILDFRKLALIGFVFLGPEGGFIFIILYNI